MCCFFVQSRLLRSHKQEGDNRIEVTNLEGFATVDDVEVVHVGGDDAVLDDIDVGARDARCEFLGAVLDELAVESVGTVLLQVVGVDARFGFRLQLVCTLDGDRHLHLDRVDEQRHDVLHFLYIGVVLQLLVHILTDGSHVVALIFTLHIFSKGTKDN